MSGNKSESMKIEPFRPVAEFIPLDASKYLPPTFSDLKSFNKRLLSNLLYYQTNYFVVSVVIGLLFLLCSFNRMLSGAIGISATGIVILFVLDKIPQLSRIREQYPVVMGVLALFNLFLLWTSFRALSYFLMAVLIPVLFWFVHGSVRSRGIANKTKNKMEQMGLTVYANSPMGLVFSKLGIDAKDYTE